jgi:hypothetical protein
MADVHVQVDCSCIALREMWLCYIYESLSFLTSKYLLPQFSFVRLAWLVNLGKRNQFKSRMRPNYYLEELNMENLRVPDIKQNIIYV